VPSSFDPFGLQIWITPSANGASPVWGSQPFPKAERFVTLASGFDTDDGALLIRARARVLGATLKVGETVEHALGERRHGYLVPASGAIEVNGVRIDARDGATIKDVVIPRITAIEDSELVMVDAPIGRAQLPHVQTH